jgi:hypothetical protein
VTVSAFAARHILATPKPAAALPPVGGYSAWYDAAQIVGQADASALAAWPDLSGNGRHLSATGTAQPTYYKTTSAKLVNGLPAVWYDGTNNYMTVTTFGAPLAQPFSLFAVWGANVYTGNAMLLMSDLGASIWHFGTFIDSHYHAYLGATLEGATSLIVDGLAHLENAVINGASSSLYLDRGLLVSGNAGAVPISSLAMCTNSSGLRVAGMICEALIYPSALSTGDRQAVENYLRTKWGTP